MADFIHIAEVEVVVENSNTYIVNCQSRMRFD
jgi:hypothetical protein